MTLHEAILQMPEELIIHHQRGINNTSSNVRPSEITILSF